MTEPEFYKLIGKRLKDLREKAGFKQKDIADKIGLPTQFLSNVENSGKRLSTYQLNRWLEAMGYTFEDMNSAEKKTTLRSVLPAGSIN